MQLLGSCWLPTLDYHLCQYIGIFWTYIHKVVEPLEVKGHGRCIGVSILCGTSCFANKEFPFQRGNNKDCKVQAE